MVLVVYCLQHSRTILMGSAPGNKYEYTSAVYTFISCDPTYLV